MDSQQVRNLQEAYIGVYDGDIREKLEFESWVNNLLEEGYDLSDYTWDELYENYTQLDESGLSQDTIQRAVIARQKRNDAALAKDTPEGDAEYEKGRVKVKRSKSQLDINKKFAREGPPVRIQRQALNNSYDLYDLILSHLIDEGYADTQESAESIMVNMSEDWRQSIMEEKKPLPIDKMKRKERELEDKADREFGPASNSSRNSPERKAALRTSERASTIGDVRRNISTRGGKRQSPMPEVGRYKPEEDLEDYKQYSSGETTAQRARRDPEFRTRMIKDRMKTMEGYDLYDVILSHLLDEGYANTNENALVIMANMSEEWIESICEI